MYTQVHELVQPGKKMDVIANITTCTYIYIKHI